LDVNDPRTTSAGTFKVSLPTTNENRAGNPVQAWLALPCLIVLFARPQPRVIRGYGSAVLLSYLLFSLLFQWQSFGGRYHLPFFLLLSPVVATLLQRAARPALLSGLTGIMFVASWPWLFGIDSRPLLSKSSEGGLGSIFATPRAQLYFANAPYLEQPFSEMADLIRDGGCTVVGISFAGGGIEYPLWPLLGAPDPELQVEWVVSGTASEVYRDPAFRPCAVVCQHCQAEASVFDLPLTYERSEFRVYMNTED
jgi:hypothetical protein